MKNLICILWCCSFYVNSSVLTLINNNSITCVLTERHLNATVYLSSDLQARFRKEERGSFVTDWITNDWYKQSMDESHYNTTLNYFMSRWHDIPIKTRTDEAIYRGKFKPTIILSLCTNESIRIEISDSTFTAKAFLNLTKENLSATTDCRWQTFIIKNINNAIQMNAVFNKNGHIGEEEVSSTSVSFNPRQLNLKNMSSVLLKISKDVPVPSYFWSNHSSIEEKSSLILSLNDSKHSCITASVSIDEGCQLDFVLECDDDRIETKNFTGFNKFGQDKQWMRIEMPTDCKGPATLTLVRKRNDTNNQIGYWAIDRLQNGTCTTNITNHIETWTTNSPINGLKNDSRCLLLDHIVTVADNKTCTRKGYYGENCEFNCILLDKGCKGYRIYQGKFNCTCDWAFDGENCDEITTTTTNYNKNSDKISANADSSSNSPTLSTTSFTASAARKIITKAETPYLAGSSIWIAIPTILFLIGILIFLYRKYVHSKIYSTSVVKYISIDDFNDRYPQMEITRSHDTTILQDDLNDFLEKELSTFCCQLDDQFLKLHNDPGKSCSIGSAQINHNRNRNNRFLPYDQTRVVIKKMKGMGITDYINASYLSSPNKDITFIAAQSPKFSTRRDFWRMIWQQQINTIIMLTNFKEFGQRYCAEYWYDQIETVWFCGEFAIRMTGFKPGEYFHRRIFEVWYGVNKMYVQHYQLNYKPENQQPLYANNVAALLTNVDKICCNNASPVLVHCSSGSELTGTFILSALALQMANVSGKINFYDLAKSMRLQRPDIIRNSEYYILAHMVVSECLIHNKYLENLIDKNESELGQQIKILQTVSLHDQCVQQWSGTSNASGLIEVGYNKYYKFLTERIPTLSTANDFWQTIFVNDIKIVVLLNETTEMNEFLYPKNFQIYDTFSRKIVYIQELINTRYSSVNKVVINVCEEVQNISEEISVNFIQLKGWSPETATPLTLQHFLEVSDLICKLSVKGKPVLIACRDGITATGLFISILYLAERFKERSKCDLLFAVRSARRNNFQFVRNFEQLQFIDRAARRINRDSYFSVSL